MADRAQLSEAIDQAIRALEELKRVWEAQEETAPPQQAASWQAAPPQQAASWQAALPQQAASWQTAPPQQAPVWQTAPQAASSWQSATPAPQQDRNQQMAVPPFRAEGRTCPVCGTKVGAQSKFCKECGSVIP